MWPLHNRSGGAQTRMSSSSDPSLPIRPTQSFRMEVRHGVRNQHGGAIPLPATHATAMHLPSPLPITSSSAFPPYLQWPDAPLSAAATVCQIADRPT